MAQFQAIFGLGNPGREYEQTRHNAGFLVIDRLAEELPPPDGAPLGPAEFKHIRRFDAEVLKTGSCYLVKPATYMNASGEAVAAVARFYRIPSEKLLVVYDDMDLELGRLRFRTRGSSGGHNGIKSIIQHLGTDTFPRLKIGIGRRHDTPSANGVVGHVLGKFSANERPEMEKALDRGAEAVLFALEHDFQEAMTAFNGKSES